MTTTSSLTISNEKVDEIRNRQEVQVTYLGLAKDDSGGYRYDVEKPAEA